MEWINIISNKDAKISKININNLYVTLFKYASIFSEFRRNIC